VYKGKENPYCSVQVARTVKKKIKRKKKRGKKWLL
jgi:hypothetical protein